MSILNLSSINKIEKQVSSKFQPIVYPHGKNMFNKNTALLNNGINSLGNIINSTNWYVSDFIPVIANATIKLRSVRTSATLYNAFYDINKNIITSTLLSSDDTIAKNNVLIVPDNAAYFRFTGRVDSINPWGLEGMQVEYGEEFTGYEPFNPFPKTPNFQNPQDVVVNGNVNINSPTLEESALWQSGGFRQIQYPYGKNLFNKDTITEGQLVTQTGTLATSSNWYASDYIPVIGSSILRFNLIHPTDSANVAFYDIDKKFISAKTNNEIRANGYKLNTPSNAVYFRFSNRLDITGQGRPDVMQVEYGEHQTSYEPFNPFPSQPNFAKPQEVILTDAQNVRGYNTISEKRDYKILRHAYDGEILAVNDNLSVKQLGTTLSISENGINGDYKYNVVFNSTNFPNLKTGSSVLHVLIIHHGTGFRVVVVTTLGQIYHNYPNRAVDGAGTALEGDIARFDESVIWDLKDRKFPSTDPNATGVEKYTPGLPEQNYEYSPKVLSDNGYGNGGFDKQITHGSDTYARYYEPSKVAYRHSFSFMGGFETTKKMTLLGTYKDNSTEAGASRICLFSTSDGGRSWYVKYEFSSYSGDANPGAAINTSASRFDDKGVGDFPNYTPDSFVINKLTHTYPSAANKEPNTIYSIGADVVITNISKSNPCVVTTATAHGLNTYDNIVIKDNPSSSAVSPSWDWLRNDTLTTISGGNGRLYKVKKITDTTFSLHEFIHNPFNNLACRHIHSINSTDDGFIIGCGEQYPYGWILWAQSHKTESSVGPLGHDLLPIVRLTSTNTAIARPLGVLMLEDPDNTIIFGSDHAYLAMPKMKLPEGRTDNVTRNSAGIFKGRLEDIDDISKFTNIYKSEEPCYFFKEKLNTWIYGGQRGEASLSFDRGKTWFRDNFGGTAEHFRGTSKNMIVIDNVIIVLKN